MYESEYTTRLNDTLTIEDSLDGDLTEVGASVVFNLEPAEAAEQPSIERETAEVGTYHKAEDETEVSYAIDTTELEVGEYFGEFEATYADNTVRSFPEGKFYFVTIREDVA